MSSADPLRPTLYLRRNLRRLLPVIAVPALATALLVAVITPTNTFRQTNLANLAPLARFTMVAPLLEGDFGPDLIQLLDLDPGLQRRLPVKVFWLRYPMLVGEAFCALVLVRCEEMPDLLARLDLRLVAGRLPVAGSGEVVMHRDVAAARDLRIGDWFGTAIDQDDATPGKYQVVGLLAGEARLALGDYLHGRVPSYVTSRSGDFQMIFARPGQKEESDAYLKFLERDGEKVFQVIDAAYVRQRLDRALRNLPLVSGFLAVAVSAIVAVIVGLLNVIAFRARAAELGILLALGRTRRRLLRKLALETALTGLLGWGAGLVLGYVGLVACDRLVLIPRGIIVRVADPAAIRISAVLPVAAVLVSVAVLRRHLRRLDPVSLLQRRWE